MGGIFAGWNFRGWNFRGWYFRGWNFPGTESTRSLPPLYPIQEKNRISCMETAHTGSMQHTRTWKKTYTGNDRQFQYLTRKLRAKIEM